MSRASAAGRSVARWVLVGPTIAATVLSTATCDRPDNQAAASIETVDGVRVIRTLDVPGRSGVMAGNSAAGTLLFSNAAAVAEGQGLRVPQHDGSGWLEARSVREFSLAVVRDDEPLIRRLDGTGAVIGGLGNVTVPGVSFLGELVNAGWLATAENGSVYFASAVRPDVIRYDAAGRIVWRSTRPIDGDVPEPALSTERGRLVPRFREVQHGIAVGPDGNLYVLTAWSTPDSARIDVLSEAGRFIRTAVVPLTGAIRVDGRGRIRLGAPDRRDPASDERALFAPFDLPRLNGPGRVRSADHAGSVILVNFWASWCAPCRREMPQLDSLAAEMQADGLVVIGLNEDVDPVDARQFLDRIGGVDYALAEGRGDLRSRYRYLGLPYTVVVDRRGRIGATFYGFGDSIDAIRAAVRTEIETGAADRHIANH